MTNKEFTPLNLSVGDWISVAYHPNIRGQVTEIIDEERLWMDGMPGSLFFGEYWPVELTDEILERNDLKGFEIPEGRECKYVHQLQKIMREMGMDSSKLRIG